LTPARQYNFAYWFRDKKSSIAEVGFLIPFKSRLIPIEVKSGEAGKLKSPHLMMKESAAPVALRFYSGNLHI
jgi:hypothetical protein